MTTEFHHGVSVNELEDAVRAITIADTSVIGVVVTGDDADNTAFPLNTVVQLAGVTPYLDKVGDSGTIGMVLDAIKDQCEPIVHVVRVAEGSNSSETINNVIGGRVQGRNTGLQALLAADAKFGVKPKILGAPGLDVTQAIATELGVIATKLRGFAYIGTSAETMDAVSQYRVNFGNKRMMLIYPEFTGWDTVSSTEKILAASARALGLRSRIDNEQGWHKSLSNVEVLGVSGISKDISFDIASSSTDADILNSNQITTLVRKGGFYFWGNRTLSTDDLYGYEVSVRTGDALADTMAASFDWAIDKPMSAPLFRWIFNGINAKLKELISAGKLLGGEAFLTQDLKAYVRQGLSVKIPISYKYTPVPPLENLTLNQVLTDQYTVNLVNGVYQASLGV